MAAQRKRKRSRLGTWMRYVILVLTGGGLGAGGWHLGERTMLGRLLGIARQEIAQGDGPDALKDGLSRVLAATDSFRRSGTYEVRLARVSVDDRLFPEGQTVHILVRVLKRGTDDRETLVWTSRSYGDRLAVAGKEELTFRWPDQPFRVDWRPGDRFAVEVWSSKSLRSRKVFAYDGATDDEFPLRTGKHIVARLADGKVADHPEANYIVFESRRIPGSEAGREPDDRVASRTRAVR